MGKRRLQHIVIDVSKGLYQIKRVYVFTCRGFPIQSSLFSLYREADNSTCGPLNSAQQQRDI